MDIRIEFADKVYNIKINDAVTYDEMDNEGYFFVETTNKIVIMNPSSYYLWKYIKEHSQLSSSNLCVIKEKELKDYFINNFTFEGDELENLSEDLNLAIYHFINEEIFLPV